MLKRLICLSFLLCSKAFCHQPYDAETLKNALSFLETKDTALELSDLDLSETDLFLIFVNPRLIGSLTLTNCNFTKCTYGQSTNASHDEDFNRIVDGLAFQRPPLNFENIAFIHCTFDGANLNYVIFNRLTQTSFKSAVLRNVMVKGAPLKCSFDGARFQHLVFCHNRIEDLSLNTAMGRKLFFRENTFFNIVSLRACNIDFFIATEGYFDRCDFQDATITNAHLSNAGFGVSNLDRAYINGLIDGGLRSSSYPADNPKVFFEKRNIRGKTDVLAAAPHGDFDDAFEALFRKPKPKEVAVFEVVHPPKRHRPSYPSAALQAVYEDALRTAGIAVRAIKGNY